MKPIKLTLHGFIGIYKGMGLDEISLDLRTLSGLIAFDAPNGKGKSTILENLQPFRRLASRAGSLQHHVYLRGSYKQFVFDLAGHKYVTLVYIDAQSGRQEGYIWKDGEPQVSGKATEYDKYIENLIGSPKLFFQSVFAAQGGDSLADMTPGDLKKLFSEFLRLDKLMEYEETAKQAANATAEKINEIQGRVDAAEEKLAEMNSLSDELHAAEQNLAHKKMQVEECRTAIKEMEAEYERFKAAAADHHAALEKDKELEAAKEQLAEKLNLARASLESAEAGYKEKARDLQKQLEEKEATLQQRDQQNALNNELKRLEMAATDKERDLEHARRELNAAEEELEGLRKAWDEYSRSMNEDIEAQGARVSELEKEQWQVDQKISDVDVEIKYLESNTEAVQRQNRIAELKRTAEKLNQRDPECKSETCVFIVDALEAQKELPRAQDEYEKLAARIQAESAKAKNRRDRLVSESEDVRQTLQNARQRHVDLVQTLKDAQNRHEKEVAEMKNRHSRAKSDADQIYEAVRGDKNRIDEIRRELESLPNYQALEAEKKNIEDRIQENENAWQQRKADYEPRIKELSDQIENIKKQQLTLKIDYEAEEAAAEKARELESAKARAEQINESLNQVRVNIEVLKQKLTDLGNLQEQVGEDKGRIDELNIELSQWRYVQQACGKDGLRALEIDGTAPMIAGYANDLLSATFGPGATVGFRTLDDDGKETLDVVVYRDDDIDGEGTLLENLSGGQQVWILKALRLALTLVSKEQSGKDVACAMADEEDGALDAESAHSFIEMYRAFLDAGGFDSIIYITHRDSCKAMADHVIRLTDRGVETDKSVARAA